MDAPSDLPLYLEIWNLAVPFSIIAWFIFVIGVLWSPFSAIACGVAANKRGLEPIGYGLLGFAASLAFFMPSICL